MPRIFLTNETYIAANDGSEIFGSAGTEQVALVEGVGQATISSTVERLDLPGAIADFTFRAVGETLQILDGSGGVLATLSSSDGKQIVFTNGALDVDYDPGSFTLTLGGEVIPTFPTSSGISPVISAIDTSITSQSPSFGGGTPGPTYTLAADAASVNEGATATFTLLTSDVSAGTDVDYTITGVSAADVMGGLTGTATIGAGGTASISVQIVADQLTEGSETLTLSLDNGQASASTVVLDTSVASANSYISGQGGNGVTSDFNIELVFEGAFSTAERAAFEMAADYLSSLITGDLPDAGDIDDIRITALLEPIDGPFGTLAFAGPTDFRFDGTSLPTEGEMTFDTADAGVQLADGTLATTIAHEMLHALGFGTLWDFLGFVTSGSTPRFTGDNAIAAYNAEFPGLASDDPLSDFGVPIESGGGHWDESVFTTEVMTPLLNGASDYMSAMTVASLEDLGYDTIFDTGIPAATMPQLNDFTSIDIDTGFTQLTGETQDSFFINDFTFMIAGDSLPYASYFEPISSIALEVIEYISDYVSWDGVLDFVVYFDGPVNFGPGGIFSYPAGDGLLPAYGGIASNGRTLAQQEALTGGDENGLDFDLGLYLLPNVDGTLTNYGFPLFFDYTPDAYSDSHIPPETHDFFSIFLHEVLHGLGFWSTAQHDGFGSSAFDDLTVQRDGQYYFEGDAVLDLLGQGLPLSIDGSRDHYAQNINGFSPIDRGAMYEFGNYEQNRWHLGQVELTVLSDLGYIVANIDTLPLVEQSDQGVSFETLNTTLLVDMKGISMGASSVHSLPQDDSLEADTPLIGGSVSGVDMTISF